ncbi:OmpP1/FadL family transporter [Sulfurivermis fontis]|uniref:OmpP1/FadL family transporter n=1 Tax=Sulfurivermis fontis TaxID=1972068 RepID=UPI000FDCA6C0|nr:porin [Sulfurivermis fontis]
MRSAGRGGIALLLCAASGAGWAAGFALSDKSVSSLGSAFAGTAAQAQDASVVYTNPAAMQRLTGSSLSIAVHQIAPTARYSDAASTVSGPNPGDAGPTRLAPNLYMVAELAPEYRFGLGVYVPFALGLEYDDRWPGRYHSIKSEMTTVNISPALSWQLTPALAVGGSIDFQYLTAELSQAVDFGTICVAQLGGPACTSLGLAPQQSDGKQTLKGDNWTTGYSLGLHYAPTPQWQFGAVYHSDTRQNISGTSDFANVPAAFAGTFTDSGGKTRVHLPESVSLSAAWAVTERLTLLADYTWTAWSRHKEFRVDFANTLADSVSTYNWHDTGFYALGLDYRLAPQWRLRAGVAYDESPVPDPEHRTPIGPDNDRRWYAVGATYAPDQTFSLDLALAHVDVEDALINNTDSLGHTLNGRFRLSGRYLSAQTSWRF